MVIEEIQRAIKSRNGLDRRSGTDRRCSTLQMRLRVGLWLQYHRVTRAGEFDFFPRDYSHKAKLLQGLTPEMVKYEFRDKESGKLTAPPCALARSLDHLWANPQLGCNLAGESTAVYAMNEIEAYLSATFKVGRLDRRKEDRRAAQA